MTTQQGWTFKVGDGEVAEVFTTIGGLYEVPTLNFFPKTIRDATTVDHAATSNVKKWEFNKQVDGPEFPITCDYLPLDVGQARLIAQDGVNAGVNIQYEWTDGTRIETYEFNVLVRDPSINSSASNDADAKDQITFTLKINAELPTKVVS